MLDLDLSLVFISLLIWVLMVVLNRVYFRPIGGIIRQREEKIGKDSEDLADTRREIEAKTRAIEQKLASAKRDSVQIREELILNGESVRERMVNEAREASRLHFDRRMRELERQIQEAEKRLMAEVDTFSQAIKKKFL